MSDIEVARYALRTFRVARSRDEVENVPLYFSIFDELFNLLTGQPAPKSKPYELVSVSVGGSHWPQGHCEAACRKYDNPLWIDLSIFGIDPKEAHQAPHEDCHCGVYGALSLEWLEEQYGQHTRDIVTVIAAEGQTIIGDQGLRTECARVVAYWCTSELRELAARQFADATMYEHVDPMIREYGLPRTEKERHKLARRGAAKKPLEAMTPKERALALKQQRGESLSGLIEKVGPRFGRK